MKDAMFLMNAPVPWPRWTRGGGNDDDDDGDEDVDDELYALRSAYNTREKIHATTSQVV